MHAHARMHAHMHVRTRTHTHTHTCTHTHTTHTHTLTLVNRIFCSLNILDSRSPTVGNFSESSRSTNNCTKYSCSTPNGRLQKRSTCTYSELFVMVCSITWLSDLTYLMLINGGTCSVCLNNIFKNSSGSVVNNHYCNFHNVCINFKPYLFRLGLLLSSFPIPPACFEAS